MGSVECVQADTEIVLYLAPQLSGLTMNCCFLMTKLDIPEFTTYKQMIAFLQEHIVVYSLGIKNIEMTVTSKLLNGTFCCCCFLLK